MDTSVSQTLGQLQPKTSPLHLPSDAWHPIFHCFIHPWQLEFLPTSCVSGTLLIRFPTQQFTSSHTHWHHALATSLSAPWSPKNFPLCHGEREVDVPEDGAGADDDCGVTEGRLDMKNFIATNKDAGNHELRQKEFANNSDTADKLGTISR